MREEYKKSGDVADMAVNAALKALDNAGINSEDIDFDNSS